MLDKLSQFERNLFDQYIVINRCVMEGFDEARNVSFKVGVQQFSITPHGCDDLESAEFMGCQFVRALGVVIQAHS